MTALLAGQGFAPQADGDSVRMRRCPFHELAESRPEIVCAVHKGVIDGALEELGSELRLEQLDIFPEPDVCVAVPSLEASQCTIESSGSRLPGLNSVPTCTRPDQCDLRHLVVGDAEDLRRLLLVHEVERCPTVPRPRDRAANMNDHAAG